MFDLDAARRWTRRSALIHKPGGETTGVTRRQMLSFSALGTGLLLPAPAWGQATDGPSMTPFGVEVVLGGRTWIVRCEAFGLKAASAMVVTSMPERRISIANATWPGTGIVYDLDLTFEQGPAGWTIEARSTALGLIRKVSFADFLDGADALAMTMSASASAAMVRKLGWTPTAVPACSLRLRPDLAWEIAAKGLRCSTGAVAAARGLMVKVLRDGRDAIMGKYVASGRGWTTETVGSPAMPTARPLLKCGKLANGSTAELRCLSLSEVVTSVGVGGQSAIALVGVWRMNFTTGAGWSGGFRSVDGLVLIGADSLSSYVVASLPVDDAPHSVSLLGGAPNLRGATDDDRIEVVARDGKIERCEVKALVTAIGLPMDGADVCEFVVDERVGEKDGHQLTMLLDDRRVPVSPWSLSYSLLGPERWWLPLQCGRLRVNRARDLIDLTYSFQGLVLVRRIGGWRLELDGSGAAPILVAQFPPQHVLERAFFHQDPPPANRNDPSASIKPVVQLDQSNPRTPDGKPLLDAKAISERYDADFTPPGSPSEADESLVRVVEARLSGRSRLAFAVPVKKRDVQLGFDLASLTNFAALPLVVAPAARRIMTAPDQTGAIRPESNPIKILEQRGVNPGSSWAKRRREVLAAVVQPDAFTTAIELPARLILSPDQNARFTSRCFAAGTFVAGAAPLWSVRLALDDVSETSHAPVGHVRAIYSPDFDPTAFDPGGAAPRQNQDAPWEKRGSARKVRLPLSIADRHELVALSTLFGLPTLPRLPAGKAPAEAKSPIPDNVVAPPDWKLAEADEEQGLYIPPPMTVRELALSAYGGSVDLLGGFEPPAAPYLKNSQKPLFDALNIEGITERAVLARDVFVEPAYKGFLFPLGIRASLLKRTERYFLKGPGGDGPTAFLLQHYFMKLSKPEKQYPGLGHPFDARDFPSPKINFRTLQTPDLLDPFAPAPGGDYEDSVQGVVRLPNADGTQAHGLAFWPRVRPKVGGEVQFEYEAVGQRGTMQSPLLFLDNTAAHDPATVEAAVRYYQEKVKPESGLKTVTMRGASRRYAPEREPGSATFETARWIMGVRGRGDNPAAPYRMDGAMEGADQPPFYPYVREAHLRLGSVQRFSGRPDDLVAVSFDPLFTRTALSTDANPAQSYLAVHGYLPTARDKWFLDEAIEPARLNVTGVGERSGGVCQPNQLVIAMSLTNGPIGGTTLLARPLFVPDPSDPPRPAGPAPLVAAPYDGAPAANSARSGVFAGADFFPSDARLLGLLSLSDLVKTALYAGAPKLIETLEIADEEANEQLAKLLAALRGVIAEVGAALDRVKAMLDKQPTANLPSVATLYPRLAAAVAGVRQALDALTAQIAAGGSPISHLPALARSANDLRQSINDLIAELDRIGHHPMPSLVDDALSELSAIAVVLREGNPFGKLIRDEVKRALIAPLVAQALRSENRLWLALAMGVGPDIDLKAEPDALLTMLTATANEAVANETIGKPVLEAIAAVDGFAKRIDGAAGDIRQIALRGFDLVDKLVAALDGALQGPLTAAQQGGVRLCTAVKASLGQVVAEGALVSLGTIDRVMAALDAPLARMAALEAEIEDGVAAFDRLGVPPIGDDYYRALRSRVHGAREIVVRLRSGTAGTLDRLRDARKGLADDADRTLKALDGVCAVDPKAIEAPLGALASWMKIRLQFLEDTLLLIARVSEALSEPPPVNLALASVQDLERIAKLVETAAGKLGSEIKTLLLSALDLLDGVTSVAQQAQPVIAAAAPILPYFDAGTQAMLQAVIDDAKQRAGAIAAQMTGLRSRLGALATTSPGDVAKALTGSTELAGALRAYARDCERRLIGALLPPVATSIDAVRRNLMATGEAARGAITQPLFAAHDAVLRTWTTLLNDHPAVLDTLKTIVRAEAIGPLVDRGNGTLHKALVDQTAELARAMNPATPLGDALAILRGIADRVDRVRRDPDTRDYANAPALYCLARDLGRLLDTVLHGQISQLIDLDQVRALVESMLFSVPLPDLDVSYAFGTDVNDLPPFFAMSKKIPKPAGKQDLELGFKLHASLADGGKTTMTASGELQAFDIMIPEIVTLSFDPVTFVSTNGSKPDFNIKLADDGILLGEAVAFIEKLSDYLGTKGNGFYIDLRFDPPGVEAGFAFNLGTIGLGEVSFLNVSLGASVELPFDNRPAIFRFNLAFRDSPFLISVAPFGGGGFLSIAFDAKGIVGFEAAFEYGGVVAFGFGPLSGQGMVLTGIYLARCAAYTRLTGFFLASGSVHIACFGLGASLYVGVEQQHGGKVEGHAEYTFSFSIGLGSIDFHVPLDRFIPQGWGGGGSSHKSNDSQRLQFAAASGDAPMKVARVPVPADAPRVRTTAKAMAEDWHEYLSYFDEDL